MNKYSTVTEFLAAQTLEHREQIDFLRELIMNIEPSLTENLKWNAPNYVFQGEDRITFNLLNKERAVKLIIHMGASKKENKKAVPVLEDDQGIVQWQSDIRGIIAFSDFEDLQQKARLLKKVISEWLLIS